MYYLRQPKNYGISLLNCTNISFTRNRSIIPYLVMIIIIIGKHLKYIGI